jgi:hypothetical protein
MWFACGVCPCVVAAACVKMALALRALDYAGIVHLLQHTTPARVGTHNRACNHLLLCNSLQQRVPHRLRARLRVVHHIRCPHPSPPQPMLGNCLVLPRKRVRIVVPVGVRLWVGLRGAGAGAGGDGTKFEFLA